MSGTQAPEGLPAWEDLPDFGLYMDLLLTCVERCYPGALTAGMINSYAESCPQKTALIVEDRRISYHELNEGIKAAASFLEKQGKTA